MVATGFLAPEVEASAASYGVNDFLVKPFDEQELILTVVGALRRAG